MMHFKGYLLALAVASVVSSPGLGHAAEAISGWELAFAAGAANADYSTSPLATGRAALGLRFFDNIAIGVTGQVDRIYGFGMGYASVYLLSGRTLGLYGRGEIGRRSGNSETAIGYAVGITVGESHDYRLYAEVVQILQPGWVDAVHVGLVFYSRR